MDDTTALREHHRLGGRRGDIGAPRPTARRRFAAAWSATPLVWRSWAAAVVTTLLIAQLGGAVNAASAACVVMIVPAALVDVRSRRLPDRMLAVAAAVLVAAVAAEAAIGAGVDITGAAIGGALFGGPLLVMHLLSPASMGYGDVKAAALLGAAIGLADAQLALPALALAAGCSATVAVIVHAPTIAFGPGLVTGATIVLAAGAWFSPTAQRAADQPAPFAWPPTSADVVIERAA